MDRFETIEGDAFLCRNGFPVFGVPRKGTILSLSKRVLLGRINGAHGIRGEVVVHAFTADPGDIAVYGALSDADGKRSFALKVVRVTDKGVIARIVGVADRNAAE